MHSTSRLNTTSWGTEGGGVADVAGVDGDDDQRESGGTSSSDDNNCRRRNCEE
jgi:hypothetical protein